MIHPPFLRTRGAGLASSALLLGVLLMIGLPPAPASASEGACSEEGGVTVVVDFTDLGGGIVAGCASGDPVTGRSALEAAGFVATDSQPGMICAIDAQPDPCPATFEGSYWSYWHGPAGGDWVSYQVGADSSDPVQGEIEGWRYNDGSTGPGIVPGNVADMERLTAPTTTVDEPSSSPASTTTDDIVLFTALGFAAVIAVLVILFLARSRRRGASEED